MVSSGCAGLVDLGSAGRHAGGVREKETKSGESSLDLSLSFP